MAKPLSAGSEIDAWCRPDYLADIDTQRPRLATPPPSEQVTVHRTRLAPAFGSSLSGRGTSRGKPRPHSRGTLSNDRSAKESSFCTASSARGMWSSYSTTAR
jgi:hypothetical protein